MSQGLEIAYRAANAPQASIVRNILLDEGIEAQVTNIALQSIAGEIPMGWTSAPCVMVPTSDLERAREIVIQFEKDISKSQKTTASEPAESGAESLENDTDPVSQSETFDSELDDEQPTWGTCPACDSVRRGKCPKCDLLDGYFGSAEYVVVDRQSHQDGDFGSESFEVDSPEDHVMCTVCDHPVIAEPLRHCEACGHDFGSGWVKPEASSSPSSNPRAVFVLIMLGILGLLAFAYFWFIGS